MLTASEFEQAFTTARCLPMSRTSQPRKADNPTAPDTQQAMPQALISAPFVVVAPPGLSREWIAACLGKLDGERRIEHAQAGDGYSSLPPELKAGLVFLDLDAPGIDRAGGGAAPSPNSAPVRRWWC